MLPICIVYNIYTVILFCLKKTVKKLNQYFVLHLGIISLFQLKTTCKYLSYPSLYGYRKSYIPGLIVNSNIYKYLWSDDAGKQSLTYIYRYYQYITNTCAFVDSPYYGIWHCFCLFSKCNKKSTTRLRSPYIVTIYLRWKFLHVGARTHCNTMKRSI